MNRDIQYREFMGKEVFLVSKNGEKRDVLGLGKLTMASRAGHKDFITFSFFNNETYKDVTIKNDNNKYKFIKK